MNADQRKQHRTHKHLLDLGRGANVKLIAALADRDRIAAELDIARKTNAELREEMERQGGQFRAGLLAESARADALESALRNMRQSIADVERTRTALDSARRDIESIAAERDSLLQRNASLAADAEGSKSLRRRLKAKTDTIHRLSSDLSRLRGDAQPTGFRYERTR